MAKDVLKVMVEAKGESAGSLTLNSANELLKRTQDNTPGLAAWVAAHTSGPAADLGTYVHEYMRSFMESPIPIRYFDGVGVGRTFHDSITIKALDIETHPMGPAVPPRDAWVGSDVFVWKAEHAVKVGELVMVGDTPVGVASHDAKRGESVTVRVRPQVVFPTASVGYGKITDCIIFDDAIADDDDSECDGYIDWEQPQEGSNTMATTGSLQSKSANAAVRNAGGVVGRVIATRTESDGHLVMVEVDCPPSHVQALINDEVLVQPTRAHEGTVGVVLDRVMREHIAQLCEDIGLENPPPDGMPFDRIFTKLAEVINVRLHDAQQEAADNKGAARELQALTHKMVAAKILQPNAGKYDATCLAMHWVEEKRQQESAEVATAQAMGRLHRDVRDASTRAQDATKNERRDVAAYLRERVSRVHNPVAKAFVEGAIDGMEAGDHVGARDAQLEASKPKPRAQGYRSVGLPSPGFEDDGHSLIRPTEAHAHERISYDAQAEQFRPNSGIVSRPSSGEPAVCYGGGYFREGVDGEPEWVPTPNARELRK